jgi:hypothetical protein
MTRLTTKSGKYIIADVTDPSFYPGKKIPASYEDPTFEGPWFFWKTDWLDGDFGGIATAQLLGYPMLYSPGFATSEKALAAAETWEADEPIRQRRDMAYRAAMSDVFGAPYGDE